MLIYVTYKNEIEINFPMKLLIKSGKHYHTRNLFMTASKRYLYLLQVSFETF